MRDSGVRSWSRRHRRREDEIAGIDVRVADFLAGDAGFERAGALPTELRADRHSGKSLRPAELELIAVPLVLEGMFEVPLGQPRPGEVANAGAEIVLFLGEQEPGSAVSMDSTLRRSVHARQTSAKTTRTPRVASAGSWPRRRRRLSVAAMSATSTASTASSRHPGRSAATMCEAFELTRVACADQIALTAFDGDVRSHVVRAPASAWQALREAWRASALGVATRSR